MRWSTLDKVTSSILSKALIIISLAGPASTALSAFSGSGFSNILIEYKYSLLGAILFIVSYVAVLLFLPKEIQASKDSRAYAEAMVGLFSGCGGTMIDVDAEFRVVEKKKIPAGIMDSLPDALRQETRVRELCEILGDNKAVYYLSTIKYEILDISMKKTRLATSALALSGVILIYHGPVQAVLNVVLD